MAAKSEPDHSDYAVIKVPASDTRAKMYVALRDLQGERDDARNEVELLREGVATLRAYIGSREGDGPIRYTEALALCDHLLAFDERQADG